MASPSSVITLGYGSWGSVNLVPTLGYGINAVIAVTRSPTYRPGFGLPGDSYRPTAPATPVSPRPAFARNPASTYRPGNPLTIGE